MRYYLKPNVAYSKDPNASSENISHRAGSITRVVEDSELTGIAKLCQSGRRALRQCGCRLQYKNKWLVHYCFSISFEQHWLAWYFMAGVSPAAVPFPPYCEGVPAPNICVCDHRYGEQLNPIECAQAVTKVRDLPFSDGSPPWTAQEG